MLPQPMLDTLELDLKRVFEHFIGELARLQVGRANPALVESVRVDAYGTVQPLKAVASVMIPDAKTIQIQPWDRGLLGAIEKGIQAANIGLNPMNDGVVIRINIPPMTEERRKEIVKIIGKYGEEAKIGVRTVRQELINKFDAMQKNKEMTEDEHHAGTKHVQDRVDHYNRQVDDTVRKKEHDVMTI